MLRGRLKGTASIALFLISSHTVAFGQEGEAVLLDPVIVSGGFIEKSWLESGVSETSAKNVSQILQHGSLLVMKGTTQTNWLHSIPKTKTVHNPRVNLTFRYIVDQ